MMTNIEKEKLALILVIDYELKRLGITDRSLVKRAKKGSGYDLLSHDGRKIEVKSTSKNQFNLGLRLNSEQEINFVKNGGYVYRVVNISGDFPKLYIVKGNEEHISIKQWATYSVPKNEQGEAIELRSS